MAKVKQRKGIRSRGATRADAPAVSRAPRVEPRAKSPRAAGRTKATGATGARPANEPPVSARVASAMSAKKRGAVTKAVAKRRAAVPGVMPAKRGAAGRGKPPVGRAAAGGRKGAPTTAPGRGSRAPVVPERVVRIKELDPFAKCGPATSVVHLYRVDESLNGLEATHLVFFDRHGWYCEHGRGCRAVEDVRKVVKTVAGSTLARTI